MWSRRDLIGQRDRGRIVQYAGAVQLGEENAAPAPHQCCGSGSGYCRWQGRATVQYHGGGLAVFAPQFVLVDVAKVALVKLKGNREKGMKSVSWLN